MKRPNHNDRWTEKAYSRENRAAAAAAAAAASSNSTGGATTSMLANKSDIEMNDMRRASTAAAHHPSCRAGQQSFGQDYRRADSTEGDGGSACPGFRLTPETHKAIEAVRFIAAHLKNEDDYAEVSHAHRPRSHAPMVTPTVMCSETDYGRRYRNP